MNQSIVSSVPTNIITGFLGVGKTTAILHLLKHKPANERWAVLVNEFGEIGVDGNLLSGQTRTEKSDSEIYITEVPGGCMCCTAGLPMQIALNQLLATARPDRLLIEPTGLGHPLEVIQTLSTQHYREVLQLKNVLTLVDARKLKDPRYTENETFNQQIQVADLVIANKSDLYRSEDEVGLISYIENYGFESDKIKFVSQGKVELGWLNHCSKHSANQHESTEQIHHHKVATLASEQVIPKSGFLCAKNEGDGFKSEGWRIVPEKTFDYERLYAWLNSLDVERLKAVFITDQGIFGFNLSEGILTQVEIDECAESRLEIIYQGTIISIKDGLFSCVFEE